jgi:drug/metabolite transporter (DMT)-like permease
MSGMLLVCATAWALYGTVLKNIWMVIPNAINSLLALLQVSLFLAFPAVPSGRVKRD